MNLQLVKIREEVSQYTRLNNRTDGENVIVLAVSKTRSSVDIFEAYRFGQRYFGESKVQEAEKKFLVPPLSDLKDAKVHMVGRLQRNKVRKALALFDCIQSVDRIAVVETIARIVQENDTKIRTREVFFQVNPTKSKTKAGFVSFSELKECVHYLEQRIHLTVRGLMCIADCDGEKEYREERARAMFQSTRSWADRLGRLCKRTKPMELSMGMSSDFRIALKEGSTMVRIGTALFGERNE